MSLRTLILSCLVLCLGSFGDAYAQGKSACKLYDGSKRVQAKDWQFDFQFGHRAYLVSLDVSPTGKVLAAGMSDGTVDFRRVSDGALLRSIKAHDKGVRGLAFNHDGCLLATGSADRSVKIWHVPTGKLRRLVAKTSHMVEHVEFSPDGSLLAAGQIDRRVVVWSAQTGKQLFQDQNFKARLLDLAFSPDGRAFAAVDQDGNVNIFDGSTIHPSMKLAGKQPANAVEYSPDGTILAIGARDGSVHLYSRAGYGEIKQIKGDLGSAGKIIFIQDGKSFLRAGESTKLDLISISSGKVIKAFQSGDRNAWRIARLHDGEGFVVASTPDRSLHLFDGDQTDPVLSIANPANGASHAEMSPDGNKIAVGFGDGSLALIDAETGRRLARHKVHGEEIKDITFFADGNHFISAAEDGRVAIWSGRTGQMSAAFETEQGGVLSLAIAQDGTRFATAGRDVPIHVWSYPDLIKLDEVGGDEPNWYFSLDYSPDGRYLAAGNASGVVKIWDAKSNILLKQLSLDGAGPAFSVHFTKDGKHLIIGSNSLGVYRFETESWKPAGLVELAEAKLQELAVDHETGQVFVGFEDGAIQIHQLDRGDAQMDHQDAKAPLREIAGHKGWINSLSVSSDGNKLVSTANDGTLRLWDISSGKELYRLHDYKDLGYALLTDGKLQLSSPALKQQIWLHNGKGAYADLDRESGKYEIMK